MKIEGYEVTLDYNTLVIDVGEYGKLEAKTVEELKGLITKHEARLARKAKDKKPDAIIVYSTSN